MNENNINKKELLIIGLTGVMGSGKSFISNLFNNLGAITYNTDVISKVVQIKNKELKNKIIDRFGEKYYAGHLVDKEYARALFYSDTDESRENLKWITETVGPYVLEHLRNYTAQMIEAGIDGYILVESAILFETGFNKECDYIIGVKSTNPINATYHRDYTTKEEWLVRMATQLPDSEKQFDFVINNDYTKAVESQVQQVHEEIVKKIS